MPLEYTSEQLVPESNMTTSVQVEAQYTDGMTNLRTKKQIKWVKSNIVLSVYSTLTKRMDILDC